MFIAVSRKNLDTKSIGSLSQGATGVMDKLRCKVIPAAGELLQERPSGWNQVGTLRRGQGPHDTADPQSMDDLCDPPRLTLVQQQHGPLFPLRYRDRLCLSGTKLFCQKPIRRCLK